MALGVRRVWKRASVDIGLSVFGDSRAHSVVMWWVLSPLSSPSATLELKDHVHTVGRFPSYYSVVAVASYEYRVWWCTLFRDCVWKFHCHTVLLGIPTRYE